EGHERSPHTASPAPPAVVPTPSARGPAGQASRGFQPAADRTGIRETTAENPVAPAPQSESHAQCTARRDQSWPVPVPDPHHEHAQTVAGTGSGSDRIAPNRRSVRPAVPGSQKSTAEAPVAPAQLSATPPLHAGRNAPRQYGPGVLRWGNPAGQPGLATLASCGNVHIGFAGCPFGATEQVELGRTIVGLIESEAGGAPQVVGIFMQLP